MAIDVLSFFLGGYLMPACFFMVLIFLEDRKADDEPTILDSTVTALISGLLWFTHGVEGRR